MTHFCACQHLSITAICVPQAGNGVDVALDIKKSAASLEGTHRCLMIIVSFGAKMTSRPHKTKTFDETLLALDLASIKFKLVDTCDGLGWSLTKANRVEIEYKRFLKLIHLYGNDQSIVPCQDVDKFWHYHILDTRKYILDCNVLFGDILHHYPYFGMKDEADAKNLASAFEKTKALYSSQFGEIPISMASSICGGGGSGPSTCGRFVEREWRPSYNDCLAKTAENPERPY